MYYSLGQKEPILLRLYVSTMFIPSASNDPGQASNALTLILEAFCGVVRIHDISQFNIIVLMPLPRAVDTVNTALLSHAQYYYFITNYAVPSTFSTPVWYALD